jgi:hypothetical protein
MREEPLRQLMVKLGMSAIQRRHDRSKNAVWLNHPCPLAPWTHKNGSDRRASFGIVVNDGGTSIFQCWACKQKGSTAKLIRLLQKFRQIDYSALFAEAEEGEKGVRRFKDRDEHFVEEPEELIPLEEAIWDGMFDPIADHPVAARFMVKRRVHRATCDKLGLAYDTEQRRIVFPVRHVDGQLYGFTGRAVSEDVQPKVRDYGGLPKRNLILGSERWRPGMKKVIVEGLIGFARMHEIGLEEHADIGALLGSEMTPEKAQVLREVGDCVVLMLDPDDAGDAGTFGTFDPLEERHIIENAAIGKLWGHVPLIVPDFPEGVDDVDDLTLEHALEMINQRAWRPTAEQRDHLRQAGKGWGVTEEKSRWQ